MKKIVFSIFDRLTGVFNVPFLAHSPGEAVRTFIDAASDSRTLLARHPGDYSLVQISEFDDQTGLYNDCAHVVLGTAAALAPSKPVLVPEEGK